MEKLTMRKLKELFRLKYEVKLNNRGIAASLGISPSTVSRATAKFEEKGLSWPLPAEMDDAQLEALLYSNSQFKTPRLSQEFLRPGHQA